MLSRAKKRKGKEREKKKEKDKRDFVTIGCPLCKSGQPEKI